MQEEASKVPVTSQEELKLRAEVERLEQELAVTSNETVAAKDDAEKAKLQRFAAYKICAKQQNEIADWKARYDAIVGCQSKEARQAEDKSRKKDTQEEQRLKDHIQDLRQTVMARMKDTSDANENLKKRKLRLRKQMTRQRKRKSSMLRLLKFVQVRRTRR